MVVPERIIWAVAVLGVQPDDIILEIGCGNGAAVALVCDKLVSGHITAIDRSAKMISRARSNNLRFLESGKADILHLSIESSQLSSNFSKVFLFNLNVFWMDPIAELAEIRRLLKPQGQFFLFHQPPPGHDLAEFEAAFCTNLQKYGVKVVERFRDERDDVRSIGLVAAPNPQANSSCGWRA